MTRLHYANTLDGNMLYMVGHTISDQFFFLETGERQYAFLSSVDIEAFKEENNGEVEALDVGPMLKASAQRQGDVLGNLALIILEKYGGSEEIAVPSNFPVVIADVLRTANIRLTVLKNWAPEREIKSAKEIKAIAENFEYTKHAYKLLERILQDSEIDGDTLIYKGKVLESEYVKREISKCLLDYDLVNVAGLIVSSGNHAAMPHHQGSGPIRPHQTIIADIFPQSTKNHYFADMTRTYVKGEPSEEMQKMYTAVSKAQKASLFALAPGKSCKEVYEVSAKIIKEHGYDVGRIGYIHSLGHGLGVDIHEAPNLSLRSKAVLEVGNVVTIEPGLYYKNVGGVRIEDTVVITEDGYQNLTNYPQNWIIP
ncbi:Xaa-Pro peptidase family protein [Candidatus Pacebacteria bacterium]|nr:Xaa-Pro peptidase family protein [Candidatus Paceibacterota bacterium]